MNFQLSTLIYLSVFIPITLNSSPKLLNNYFNNIITSQNCSSVKSENDVCYFIGQISMNAVSAGAFYTCFQTGTPAACTIGYAILDCQRTKACDGVIKKVTSKGCSYIVKRVGDAYEIAGEATKEKLSELKKTYDSLNSVEGMFWLKYYLQ